MPSEFENLTATARQILAIEDLLGCSYLPNRRNPLPELDIPDAAPRNAPGQASPGPPTRPAPANVPRYDRTGQFDDLPPELSRDDKIRLLKELDETYVRGCTRCGLCKSRTHTVFGEGDPDARIMFVGEGPGADEDASGRPFVGRAGQLLDKMITAMGLDRQQVFIGNVVKCRPPGNRTPAPEEIQACWAYLVRQLQIIRPEVIVTLGNPATQNLLNTRTGITRLRGAWQQLPDLGGGLGGTAVMPTFHPSYVLRQYTPEVRGKVWSDLQAVLTRLGMDLPKRS